MAALQKLRVRAVAMKHYVAAMKEVEKHIQTLFEASMLEARSGFRLAITMDVVVFILGIFLIAICAWLALFRDETLSDCLISRYIGKRVKQAVR